MMVFYIDDDPDDVDVFIDALKTVSASLTCVTARDGEEALDTLQKMVIAPQVIFLDINMPKMDGMQFLREVKKDDQFKDIPIVIYSTSSDKRQVTEFYRMGAHKFLPKHPNYQLLCQELNTILREFN